jgi:hypothetical protein
MQGSPACPTSTDERSATEPDNPAGVDGRIVDGRQGSPGVDHPVAQGRRGRHCARSPVAMMMLEATEPSTALSMPDAPAWPSVMVKWSAADPAITPMIPAPRPPDPSSARLGRPISADLEAVLLRCLAKAPRGSLATANALSEALAACDATGTWTAAVAEA